MLFIIGLLGCGSDKLEPMLTGSITAPHPELGDLSGTFLGYKAFAFDDQGTFAAYITSHQQTTCSDVAAYLSTDSESNSNNVLVAGHCNLFIKVTDYDDTEGFQAQDDSIASAASSIECAMGDGSFSTEGGETSWTGAWWLGIPKNFTWDFSGDKELGYTLDVDMTLFSGSFVNDEFDRNDATGNVSGLIDATVCSDLAGTGFF